MIEKKTLLIKFQYLAFLILFGVGTFFGGMYLGMRGYTYELSTATPYIQVSNKDSINTNVDFSMFWSVWDLIFDEYLLKPIEPQKLLYGAIEGMVAALDDPYTTFLSPDINKQVQSNLNQTYEGIGVELSIKDNQLYVVAPLDGSPAKEAGIMQGDYIIEIDGEDSSGLNLSEAVQKIRGPAGSVVSLTIFRQDAPETQNVKIKRGNIKIDSVTWEDKGDGIAYIKISTFGESTNKEWDKVAAEVNVSMNELDSIILDLRGNPGGYMASAVHIAGEFFKDKVVMYQRDISGKDIPFKTNRIGVFNNLPVYILLDKGSASASEILAGALKYHVNATLIGENSFGKGTIQDYRQFEDGSGVNITIAKWLTPDKKWVNETKGIAVDKEVKFDIEKYKSEEKIDNQLEAAIKIAKGEQYD